MEDDRKFTLDSGRAFAEGNEALGEELMLMEIEEVMLTLEKWGRQDEDALAVLQAHMDGTMPAEIDMDAPLSIEDVLCLPEMGGAFTVNPEFRRKGENVNDNQIREAIKKGLLMPLPLSAKKHLLSRRQIRTLLEPPPTERAQVPKPAAAAARPASRRTQADPDAALEAALRMAAEMKGMKKR